MPNINLSEISNLIKEQIKYECREQRSCHKTHKSSEIDNIRNIGIKEHFSYNAGKIADNLNKPSLLRYKNTSYHLGRNYNNGDRKKVFEEVFKA